MVKTLIVLTGPTGVGKTRAALKLAVHLGTEIVSADSRQIYREMKIGTAVPSQQELKSVNHHFIQSHSIKNNYNASRYEEEALNVIQQLFQRKKTVLLTGGSMLYINAVCQGIDPMPDSDPEIRNKLKERLEKEGIASLRLQLRQIDPAYYMRVDLKNPNRIVHALEISLLTGKPYSSFLLAKKGKRPFSILKIGLFCDRTELYRRINHRVDQMVQEGLEKEARDLFSRKHLNALNTVGYREFFSYFQGEISKTEAIELIKRNTRRYARKQLTWLRNDPEINWFRSSELAKIKRFIENFNPNE